MRLSLQRRVLCWSTGVQVRELVRQSAVYIDKIFKGAKPADLPVEQPTKFALIINLKAAKALGLKVPPNVLAGADEVIGPTSAIGRLC
jgi:putative tryptophan/tyrosine transport system substrate-binding protein